MALLAGQHLVVLDVETTGWSAAEGHDVLEVARVDVDDATIAGEWSSLVRPRRPIPAEATGIHGITEDMVATAPAAAEVAGPLGDACEARPLVFHNAAFDLPFVSSMMRAAGRRPLYGAVIDTLGLARGLFGSGSNTLTELATRLGIPVARSHRALDDARVTAGVLLALAPRWERERGVRSIDELAAASQDAIRLLARRG